MDSEIEKVLPKPRKREMRDDFISRCMSNKEAKREFPNQQQRLAACHSLFRRRKNKDNIDNALDELRNDLDEEGDDFEKQ